MIRALSLRARLLLAVAAVTLVALVLADVAVYASLRSYLVHQVDDALVHANAPIARALARGRPGPGPDQPPLGVNRPPGGARAGQLCELALNAAPGQFIEVLTARGSVAGGGADRCSAHQPGGSVSASPLLPANLVTRARALPGGGAGLLFSAPPSAGNGPSFRVRVSPLPDGGALVVAAPLGDLGDTLSQLLWVEIAVTAGALLTAALLGLWSVRVGLRPLRDMERTAEAIAVGDLMHRVPNSNPRSEVGHVASALNVMLGRIEETVDELRASEHRLRRFVGDASHELRTPIAAVAAYAELFGRGASSRPEDLERVMGGIAKESARMAKLVEDLLTLARFDEHHLLGPEPVELVGLAVEAAETARTVGSEWPVAVVADGPVEALGDRAALRRVIDNLLANVRAHTPPGTAATLTVRRVGAEAVIGVADDGPGISPEEAPLVFERFFRADPSRSRTTGGAGLGLAIVASIVAAHGGRAVAAARAEGGTLIEVTLPVLDEEPLE